MPKGGGLSAAGISCREGHLTINGLKLHYLAWGERRREAILLLHGYANCAATWIPLAGKLARHYRVFAPDFRGHGDSQWDEAGRYGGRYHLADITAFINQLDIDRLSILGHSMGGLVALAYAAANPRQVNKLIIVDIGPEFSLRSEARLKETSRLRRAEYDSLVEVTDYLKLVDPPASRSCLSREAACLTRRNDRGRFVWKHNYSPVKRGSRREAADNAGRWEVIRALKCPTLLIRGERSDILDAGVARRMVAAMPDAELVTIAGAGHYAHRDRPRLFTAAVCRFLQPEAGA